MDFKLPWHCNSYPIQAWDLPITRIRMHAITRIARGPALIGISNTGYTNKHCSSYIVLHRFTNQVKHVVYPSSKTSFRAKSRESRRNSCHAWRHLGKPLHPHNGQELSLPSSFIAECHSPLCCCTLHAACQPYECSMTQGGTGLSRHQSP